MVLAESVKNNKVNGNGSIKVWKLDKKNIKDTGTGIESKFKGGIETYTSAFFCTIRCDYNHHHHRHLH